MSAAVEQAESQLPDRPVQVMTRLREVRAEINARFIEIGELLLEARRENYWHTLGYNSFEEFAEETLGMSYRKAAYLAQCVDVWIDKLNMPRDELCEIGWTKLKEIVTVATSVTPAPGIVLPRDEADHLVPKTPEDNARDWLNYAKGKTTSDLNLAVRKQMAPPHLRNQVRKYSTVGYGLFDDEREIVEEAIELAKREGGTERTGRALVFICEDYIIEAQARHAQALAVASKQAGQ